MKVVLFKPPDICSLFPHINTEPSLALAFLSTVLKINNIDVTAIDSSLLFTKNDLQNESPDKIIKYLIKLIEKEIPDILGISSYTLVMPFVAEFSRHFKAKHPEIPIILGGHNATHLPIETLDLIRSIDFLVRGEGEITFLELCKKLSKGDKNFSTIEGISFRNNFGEIINTPNRPYIKNLDELPFVDFESFLYLPKHCTFNFQFSRGCSGNCSFCSTHAMWKLPRYFSSEHCLKQIKLITKLYPEHGLWFPDDNLFSNIQIGKEIISKLHKNFPDNEFNILSRVEVLSSDMINFLKENNVNSIFVGVESNNPKSLLFFNKTLRPDIYLNKVKNTIEQLNNKKIDMALAFIIGTPYENKEDIIQTKEFIIKTVDKFEYAYFMCHPITLYPGTLLWDKYIRKEIGIFKLKQTRSPSFIVQKYDHLVWMTPQLYQIKNTSMDNDEFEIFLTNTINELLSHDKNLENESVPGKEYFSI